MPGFDGTGPRGMGPMTGGGRGFCAVPAAGRPRFQRWGFGGRGGGRGWRNRFYATGVPGWAWFGGAGPNAVPPRMTAQDEAAMLRDEAAALEADLKGLRERLAAIEAEGQAEK